jgi:Flp pilus assembly protein TadD
MEPENTEALNALGKLHKMRGRAKPAREAWEKSLEINEDQPEIASELEDL